MAGHGFEGMRQGRSLSLEAQVHGRCVRSTASSTTYRQQQRIPSHGCRIASGHITGTTSTLDQRASNSIQIQIEAMSFLNYVTGNTTKQEVRNSYCW